MYTQYIILRYILLSIIGLTATTTFKLSMEQKNLTSATNEFIIKSKKLHAADHDKHIIRVFLFATVNYAI